MMIVPLLGQKAAGRIAVVSDEDYEAVQSYDWYCYEVQRKNRVNGPYAITVLRVNGKSSSKGMHRIVAARITAELGEPEWTRVDHQDHDGLNNQRYNLRDGSGGRNEQNRQVEGRGSSKYKGVYWHKGGGKWMAYITMDGKRIHLGLHVEEADAARAYNQAAAEHFGEYAVLNAVSYR